MYFLYQGSEELFIDLSDLRAETIFLEEPDTFLRTDITPPQTMSGFHPAWITNNHSLPEILHISLMKG
jgi:RES domain-containing protein